MLRNGLKVLCVWLFVSPALQAQTCFSPSPNFTAMGDAYFNVNGAPELNADDPALQFLQTLQGDWHGQAYEVECFGSDSEPRREQRHAQVEAEIKPSSSALLMAELTKTYRHGIIAGDTVFLLDKTSVFDLAVRGDEVMATERLRRVWANSGSQMIEIVSSIKLLSRDQLLIDWQLYSNGVYVFSQTLELQR